ncbi:MAG: diphosphomevalonate decarboxylase [Spirochaetia bacterium]|nr:diphosphomevalonate decarboxylase [Spirochaetia bacterium]
MSGTKPKPASGAATPGAVLVRTSPSLALVKYWGKKPGGRNLPATTSLAVTLAGLDTRTLVRVAAPGEGDAVRVGGELQDAARYAPFFGEARRLFRSPLHFAASSENSFPSAAGLASSSSGFAALALGCAALSGRSGGTRANALASELARLGSASAARAVYGGFTLLPAGARRAEPLEDPGYWPDFRVVVALATREKKRDSSRGAMELTRTSSPYYAPWVRDARKVSREALAAFRSRDAEKLGDLMRLSYLRMHASALAAVPPVLYWLPDSVALIRACADLRARGIGAWETMDAGPQVKVFCLAPELAAVEAALRGAVPGCELIVAKPGAGPDLGPAPGDGMMDRGSGTP